MKEEKPFVRAIPLPVKYLKPGVLTLEVVEYALRSRHMPNGYWITLAAMVIPSKDRTVFGASACSPEDELLFDRADAANRAMGRARQVGFRVWAEKVFVGMAAEAQHDTLFGQELAAVFLTPAEFNLEKIQAMAEPLYLKVAAHAAAMGALHAQKVLNHWDPDFDWSFAPKPRKEK